MPGFGRGFRYAVAEERKEGDMKSGMTVWIYKNRGQSYDCKGVFSSKVDEATLLPSPDFPDVPELFEPTGWAPAVVVVKRKVCGKDYLTAYPADADGNPDRNCSSGGCYISSSDSRFVSEYPVPLHDRKE